MKRLVTLLIAITLISVIFSINTNNNKKDQEKNYVRQINKYKQQLELSNAVRDSLVYRLDSLGAISKDILRSDSVKIVEIREVPKKLQNLTAKQTQDKMIKLYAASQQR